MTDFNVHVYHHIVPDASVTQALADLKELVSMNHVELLAALQGVGSELAKANGEIQAKLAALQSALDNADNVPQTIVDAVTALQGAAQALDDIVPDAPPTP